MSRQLSGVIMIGLVMLSLAGASGCSGGSDEPPPANAQRISVSFGDSLSFDQTALTAQAGTPVLLTVKSTGGTDHDFTIEGMPGRDVKNVIQSGHGHAKAGAVIGHPKQNGEVMIRFTPLTPGTYEFFCSVIGHRDAGMKGTLTVT